jgi:7-cyano-7-deazaguanine reductase
VNRILDDLVSMIEPRQMSVEGEFTARGGVTSRVMAEYQEEK